MNQVLDVISSHRSIRKYTDKKIEEALLHDILEKAQYASTSSYLQPYSIIRVKDPKSREKLAEYAGGQPYVETAAEFLVFCADLNHIKLASENLNIQMEQGYTESFLIASLDAAIYAQTVLLGAESCGIGGVYIGGIRNKPKEVCDLLNIPENVYPVFGMCLGYPAQDPERKPRLPLKMILKNEKYTDISASELEDYDEQVKTYYVKRTKGKVDNTWSEQVSEKLKGEIRPHMKAFLASKKLNTK